MLFLWLIMNGSLPSRLKGNPYEGIIIGEKYFFEGIDGKGVVATITTASVDENAKTAYFGTSNGQILTRTMSDDELNDYKATPEAFFGRIQPGICHNIRKIIKLRKLI